MTGEVNIGHSIFSFTMKEPPSSRQGLFFFEFKMGIREIYTPFYERKKNNNY